MTRVGIPRALLYYQYLPMWKTFFERLGAEIVVSEPTTRATLAEGSSRVVADTCLPAKVFIGHTLSLVGRCDCIFIPAIRSLRPRTYNCAKFLGLPDMTRAVIPEAPPILEIDVDINLGKRHLYQAIYRLARHFTWNPFRVRDAATAAWQAFQGYRETSRCGLTQVQAMHSMGFGQGATARPPEQPQITIGIIGHGYLLYDEHINYQLLKRLAQYNVRVVTPEMLAEDECSAAVSRLAGTPYWTYEDEVVGAGGHYLANGTDGIIGVMAFGCGPDSLMMDMIHREASRLKTTPFMCLTLEEHTSETGVVTRLEAFLDMIQRKKRRPAAVCS